MRSVLRTTNKVSRIQVVTSLTSLMHTPKSNVELILAILQIGLDEVLSRDEEFKKP
eukprot:m.147010 g.147010  ORF g.147010 m.147010 type:complete len:56 (+) comp14170_c0_seq3:818-985(+)